MNRTEYKNNFYKEHYERINLAVPKGMKDIIRTLAADKGMSINAYIQDLVRKDQCGMFDTMQVAEKNREMISGITGNMHDGYDIIFKDGHSCHCRTKKDVRSCKNVSCTRFQKYCTRHLFSCQLPVCYLLVTGTFSCVLMVSDRFSEYKENPENTGFSGFVALFRYSVELSLAELRSATSCFETVFLTLFHSRVTS